MFRKTTLCWLALGVVAGSAMLSLVAHATSPGFVIFVPAHGEPSQVGASYVGPSHVVSRVEAPHGWWGYCCTGDHSTHNTGSVPLLARPSPLLSTSSVERWRRDACLRARGYPTRSGCLSFRLRAARQEESQKSLRSFRCPSRSGARCGTKERKERRPKVRNW